MTKRKCNDTAAARALRRRTRVQRSFEHLVTGALVILPRLIDECRPKDAANIITDLVRIHLSRPAPNPDDEPDCLDCLLEDIASKPENLEPADSPVRPISLPADGSLNSRP